MAILLSNEIMDAVVKELQQASNSVQIITAYCKEKTFQYLDKKINTTVKEKKLLVRFRLDDILKGSTDFGILQYGLENDWEVYVRFDLHAKTYIIDNKRGLVGSANLTNSGLNIGKNGNMEIATLVDIGSNDIEKINRLFKDAIKVDDFLLENFKQQVNTIRKEDFRKGYSWDNTIMKLFNPHIETLFSYELPDNSELVKGNFFQFLDINYDGNEEGFKEAFRWSNSYLWLLEQLKDNNGCLYFGEATKKLHECLVEDPKPYRKDVKNLLSNLLTLIDKLNMDEIVIDRPNYSQRIRLKM